MPQMTVDAAKNYTDESDLRSMLPSQERAEELRSIFSEYVEYLDEDLNTPWKGRVIATVGPLDDESVEDVEEAMNFIGAIVDERKELPDGSVKLFSKGYYEHIGA